MATIKMSRLYSPEDSNKKRDVLYPETNAESVVTRYDTDNNPITLDSDIGPKIVFGNISNIDKPAVSKRECLQFHIVKTGVTNIPSGLLK